MSLASSTNNRPEASARSLWAPLQADLQFGQATDGDSKWGRILFNRGFHALVCYRIAHRLRKGPLAFMGLILTRICQMLYSIDIDPRADIAGGIIIYHGVGLVIGQGVIIEERVILFHGVTLGIKRSARNDGFPYIESDTVIGTGAKLLGKIRVGARTVIGANAVVTRDIPANCIVSVPAPTISARSTAASHSG